MIGREQTSEGQRLAVGQYRSAMCSCGAEKKPGQSFCNVCYHALPRPLQKPLVGTYGSRYELAYFAAAEWLEARRQGKRTE